MKLSYGSITLVFYKTSNHPPFLTVNSDKGGILLANVWFFSLTNQFFFHEATSVIFSVGTLFHHLFIGSSGEQQRKLKNNTKYKIIALVHSI